MLLSASAGFNSYGSLCQMVCALHHGRSKLIAAAQSSDDENFGDIPMWTIQYQGRRIERREGESVLDALVRSGADVAFSCKKGSCQVCMLKATDGAPLAESQIGLRQSSREKGYFLPCQMRGPGDLAVEKARAEDRSVSALVVGKERLAPDVVRLQLDAGPAFTWRPGQFVNLRRADGLTRSYSLASISEQDYLIELHVRCHPDGAMSRWLCDELPIGGEIEVQGPHGTCYYHADEPERRLLLIAGGTGLGPLSAIARDALNQGHRGEIYLYHGARVTSGLYLDAHLRALLASHPNFHYVGCLSEELHFEHAQGLVSEVALSRHQALGGWRLFLCGPPAMVQAARWRAFAQGADRELIHADPFESSRPYLPDDAKTLGSIAPDLELWAALREGDGLTEILSDFYTRVFADPRLAPFFHNVTKQRVIEKQYAFLHQVFTGRQVYFGLRPFNAHHWMVISDELFDYRESLMIECMRRYGLPEHLIRRWGTLHEKFRRDIVKSSPRGIVEDGIERNQERFDTLTMTVGALCDSCGSPVEAGTVVRYHARTGLLYCPACQPTPAHESAGHES